MKHAKIVIPLAISILLLVCAIWILRSESSPPNVILISIDTLRADHLGCYGYERDTSPHLDNLARESVLFEANFAPSPSTTPSHISMLTSLYPLTHDVLSNRERLSYSEDIIPLTQILKDNGFRTGGFVGGAGVSKIKGFDRGFDFWSEERYMSPHLPDVKQWVLENQDEKFFLFFHFYDVHAPYVFRQNFENMYNDLSYYEELIAKIDKILDVEELSYENYQLLTNQEKFILLCSHLIQEIRKPIDKDVRFAAQKDLFSHLSEWRQSPDFKKQIQLLIDSYDAGIKYTDHFIGKFFSFLKSNNLWENTLLVVTSDHGEEFMDHDILTHGNGLYDTLIYVPLIIKMPGLSGKHVKRISDLSELVDIMPTILDILDIPFKDQMQGKSLCPAIFGQERDKKNMVFASFEIGDAPKKRSVRTERWKYIIFDMDFSEKDKFFDFVNDKHENKNLLHQKNEEIEILRSYLSEHMRECLGLYQAKYSKHRKDEKSFPEELQKKHLEVLRALGYIH